MTGAPGSWVVLDGEGGAAFQSPFTRRRVPAGLHTARVRGVGSPQTMSPEQARGEPVDGRSDLYSVGCLAFELLTGSPPFDGDDFLVVALKHQQEPIPRMSSGFAHWQAFFDRALAKRPEDRFVDAADMAAALDQVIRAPRGPPPQSPQSPQRRALPLLIAMALLLLVALVWWWRSESALGAAGCRAGQPRTSALPRLRRRSRSDTGSTAASTAPMRCCCRCSRASRSTPTPSTCASGSIVDPLWRWAIDRSSAEPLRK